MSEDHKALTRPGTLEADASAQELVRFWISNNQDHVSLLVGSAGDPSKEPAMWGFILADIAKHVTKILKEQSPDGPSAPHIMEQVLGGLTERLKHAPQLTGQTRKAER